MFAGGTLSTEAAKVERSRSELVAVAAAAAAAAAAAVVKTTL